jgi:alpha-L-glutamate ligase-like protein
MSVFGGLFRREPLGMNRRNVLIRNLNSPSSLELATDKARFKRELQRAGIAVPSTYLEIHDFSQIPPADTFPDEFVIKPNRGLGGNGILVLSRSGEAFMSPSGRTYSMDHIVRHIRKILDGEFSVFGEEDSTLLEEKIHPSKSLQFKNAVGLPDIRVFCYRFSPVMAMLRYPTLKSDGRSNLAQGAVGMGIDMERGEITHIHSKKSTAPFRLEDFGVPPSYIVPKWDEIKSVAVRATEISHLQVSGVDIVLNPDDRVIVLEINGRPGLEIQSINEISLCAVMGAKHK